MIFFPASLYKFGINFSKTVIRVFLSTFFKTVTETNELSCCSFHFRPKKKPSKKREGKGAGIAKAKRQRGQKRAEKAHVTRSNRQVSALAPPSTFVASHHQLTEC